MALPEVLLVVILVPSLFRGLRTTLSHYSARMVPILIVTAVVTFAYSAVTTNSGPLMRWRLQVANVYVMMAAVGWRGKSRRQVSFKQGHAPPRWQHADRERMPATRGVS
jgi:hypothetical protein